MTTILVAGGAGFMGSNFIQWVLQETPHRVVNLDILTYAANLENLSGLDQESRYHFVRGDICDRGLLTQVFDQFDIDVVVNFAAESYVDRSVLEPEIFVQTNIAGTQALLDAAISAWRGRLNADWVDDIRPPVRFVQVSTAEVYGDLAPSDSFSEASPMGPKTPYAASKASADLLVNAYRATYGMPINVVRFSIVYGPYQPPEKFIPSIIDSAFTDAHPRIYGDGLQVRDWLHVWDASAAINSILEHGRAGETYNVGGSSPRTNLDVLAAVAHALDHGEVRPSFISDRVGNDRRIVLDVSKIEAEVGWRPRRTFEEGVAQTVTWYIDRPDWIRRVKSGMYRTTRPADSGQ